MNGVIRAIWDTIIRNWCFYSSSISHCYNWNNFRVWLLIKFGLNCLNLVRYFIFGINLVNCGLHCLNCLLFFTRRFFLLDLDVFISCIFLLWQHSFQVMFRIVFLHMGQSTSHLHHLTHWWKSEHLRFRFFFLHFLFFLLFLDLFDFFYNSFTNIS